MRISAFLENIGQASRETGRPLQELLAQFREEGLESVYANYSWSLKSREQQLVPLLGKIGLALEGLWDTIPFNAMTDEEGEAAYTAMIDCAARNGAKHLLITPGVFHGRDEEGRVTREEVADREPEIQRMIAAMRRAKEYGEEKGVAVTMEDYDVFSSPIVFPEVLRRFFEEIPGLQCTFDTGNFIPCDRDVREEFAYYKDKIIAIHLKDRIENDDQGGIEKEPYITESGRKYYPAVVGCGDMHIPEIIAEMNKMGYQGPGIIELFGSTDIAAKMTASIRWMKGNALNC